MVPPELSKCSAPPWQPEVSGHVLRIDQKNSATRLLSPADEECYLPVLSPQSRGRGKKVYRGFAEYVDRVERYSAPVAWVSRSGCGVLYPMACCFSPGPLHVPR